MKRLLLAGFVSLGVAAAAQTPFTFDVVSIKPVQPGQTGLPPRLTVEGIPLVFPASGGRVSRPCDHRADADPDSVQDG